MAHLLRERLQPTRTAPATFAGKLPKKHWATLPEADIVPALLREAPSRVRAHAEAAPGDVRALLPPLDAPEAAVRAALRACAACPLHVETTAVPGEGPLGAAIALVGEQPGDAEDRAGRPFVGPAGQVLGATLPRRRPRPRPRSTSPTPSKHFRHRRDGYGKRLHETPDRGHVEVCRPWVVFELQRVRPQVVVALGVTAAHALLGRIVAVGRSRGEVLVRPGGVPLVVGPHPSAVLRAREGSDAVRAHLVATLQQARALAG
ncbi:MAG: uracil-DNA glycosylase family protein [Myxococcota bacterium]